MDEWHAFCSIICLIIFATYLGDISISIHVGPTLFFLVTACYSIGEMNQIYLTKSPIDGHLDVSNLCLQRRLCKDSLWGHCVLSYSLCML